MDPRESKREPLNKKAVDPASVQRAAPPPLQTAIKTKTTLPLQIRHQDFVSDLMGQIESGANYDYDMYNKYKVRKYNLVNTEGEPVEILIYDANTLHYPFLEDQALKRADSLLVAAKALFREDKISDQDVQYLDKISEDIQRKIKAFYSKSITSDKDFEDQLKALSKLLDDLMENIAFAWSNNTPLAKKLKLTPADYQDFFKHLEHYVENEVADFAKLQYLTVNTNPKVNSFEYYERGTSGARGKEFRSSHNRGEAGIPNFICSSSGYVDGIAANGAPILHVTSPGDFSHASLPAYDWYKREKTLEGEREKKEGRKKGYYKDHFKGYYAPESVQIATANMLSLEREMRSRLTAEEEKGPSTLSWINVSLLTVIDDKEQQARIYHETILAADRLRSRANPSFIPITFDFGVNAAASKQTGIRSLISLVALTHPPEQQLENQRAFFQLQEKLLATLAKSTTPLESTKITSQDNPMRRLFKLYSLLSKKLEEFQSIEGAFKKKAAVYDAAMTVFEGNPNEKNREAVKKAENALNVAKKNISKTANNCYDDYIAEYHKLETQIKENLSALETMHLPNAHPGVRSTRAVCLDFGQALDLYLNDKWNQEAYNFHLQSRIGDLGDHLEVIDHYTSDGQAHTASSYNCKSRNDRSLIAGLHKVALNAEHDGRKVDLFELAVSSASSQTPLADTHGGGSKSLNKVIDPEGHPNLVFSRRQAATAKWSTKQFFDKIRKALGKVDRYKPTPKLVAPVKATEFSNLFRQQFFNESAQGFVGDALILHDAIFLNNTPPSDPAQFITHVIQQFLDLANTYDYQKHINYSRDVLFKFLTAVQNLSPPIAEVKSHKRESSSFEVALSTQKSKLAEQVSSFEGFQRKMNERASISLSNPRFFHIDSTDTKNVIIAYQALSLAEKSKDSHIFDQVAKLEALKKAIEAWVDKKLGGSQVNDKGTLKEESRLPAMLALQDHVQVKLQEKHQAILTGFRNGSLLAPEPPPRPVTPRRSSTSE